MSKESIAVILPVYNTEKFLSKCVESVASQTHSHLEILLVDDGSSDGCSSMSDEFALKDSRMIVIHKKNGGQAEARNKGIELSSAGYIGFVDSDDYISIEMYSHLLKLIHVHNADFAECQMIKFSDQEIPSFDQKEEVHAFEGLKLIKGLLGDRYFHDTVPNVLVKSGIAKMVPFEEGKIHEDVLWPYLVLGKCRRAVSTTRVLYAYYQREDSTMNSAYSEKRFDALDALQTRSQKVKKDYPALYAIAERTYAGSCMYHYQMLARTKNKADYRKYMKILHKRYLASDRNAFFPSLRLKYKIWNSLFAMMPFTTSSIRNFFRIGL